MKKKVAKLSEPETETEKISKTATKILKSQIVQFLSEVPIASMPTVKPEYQKRHIISGGKPTRIFSSSLIMPLPKARYLSTIYPNRRLSRKYKVAISLLVSSG